LNRSSGCQFLTFFIQPIRRLAFLANCGLPPPGCKGRLYKQSQFRPWRPWGAPFFQYSIIPAFQLPVTPGGTRQSPVRRRGWRFWAKNPEYRFDSCGILVFWYSGLAPLKTRFLGPWCLCVWHVARGYLDFWPKKTVFGGRRPCRVAVWVFGAKTRVSSAAPAAGLLVQTNPILEEGAGCVSRTIPLSQSAGRIQDSAYAKQGSSRRNLAHNQGRGTAPPGPGKEDFDGADAEIS
jgi:hypothetical protein